MGARDSRGIRNSQIGITSKNVLLLCERKKRTQIVSTASSFQVNALFFRHRVVAADHFC
jgi:hypothetical protein